MPLGQEPAERAAVIVQMRKEMGREITMMDSLISGIATSQAATLATRNVKDFEDNGLEIINPWEFGAP